jgi:hypothetical protein
VLLHEPRRGLLLLLLLLRAGADIDDARDTDTPKVALTELIVARVAAVQQAKEAAEQKKRCEKRLFLSQLCTKAMLLPRQTRDKHRKS